MTQLKDDPSVQFTNWLNPTNLPSQTYVCGFCGDNVASGSGYEAADSRTGMRNFAFVRICPGCKAPTFFSGLGKRYHIAVAEKAPTGLSFLEYVEYLEKNGFVPPKGKSWVDYIRTRGNEANHEIVLMGVADAIALISFIEMLLRFIYEFPDMVPKSTNP